MKYCLLYLTLAVVVACNNKTSKEPGSKLVDPPMDSSDIIETQLLYPGLIDSVVSKYTRNSVDLEGLSTEGGELIFYKDHDSIPVLLIAKNYGETGQNEEKIWLMGKDKTPILEYLKDIDYDKPMYEPGSKISRTTITYMLFINGAPYAMLDSGRNLMRVDSATFAERAERVKAVLPDYLSQAGIKH
jgi:hypothetical protein